MINLQNSWVISPVTIPNTDICCYLNGNQVLSVGGFGGSGANSNCYMATINSDGSLTPFIQVNSFPDILYRPALAITKPNGIMHFLGGQHGSGFAASQVFYTFSMTPTGFSMINQTEIFPPGLLFTSTSIYASNGWIYLIGGADQTNTNSVNTWALQTDNLGHITTYKQVAQIPQTLQTGGLQYFASVEINGYLIVCGGADNPGVIHAEMYKAKLLSSGDLGPWQYIGNMPSGVRLSHGAVSFEDFMIVAGGGSNASGTILTPTVDLLRFDANCNLISGTIHPSPLALLGRNLWKSAFIYNKILYLVGTVYLSGAPFPIQSLSLV
jgi:hypothetical protein